MVRRSCSRMGFVLCTKTEYEAASDQRGTLGLRIPDGMVYGVTSTYNYDGQHWLSDGFGEHGYHEDRCCVREHGRFFRCCGDPESRQSGVVPPRLHASNGTSKQLPKHRPEPPEMRGPTPTIKNPNASSCLKNDTNYQQRLEDVILNVSSAIACQAWCFHDLKCAFFSWVSDEFPDPSHRRKCYLKHLYAPAKPLKGVISGPDECLPQKVPLPLAQQLGHPLICNPPKVNREGTGTLVVVLASLRAMRLTYDGLRVFVLETLGAKVHLAFSVARGPQYRDYFRYADYVWEVDEPLQFDFQDYFNEISQTCYNRSFTKQDTFSITKGGNLLGGLSGISGSGAPQMFFKWVALQQMAHLGLFDRYQHIIVTRSDRMYAEPHPPVNRLPPMHVLIPQGQDYGGVNDRHLVMHSSDAPRILNQLHMLLYVPLRLQKFPLGTDAGPNCEAGLKWWLAEHLHLRISRFPIVAYLVTDRLYNYLGKPPNSNGGQLRLGHIPIFPKYMEEYDAVTENLKKKPSHDHKP